MFDYEIVAGGTGIAGGTASLTLSLPVNANSNTTEFITAGRYDDASTSINYQLTGQISGTTVVLLIPNVSGTLIRLSSLTSTTLPAALATGDTVRISGFYEAA
jgi:hypothetical protein